MIKSERQTAKHIAEELNIPWKLIYVNTPQEEIQQWRLKNLETKERGHLEDVTMKRAEDMFEPPTKDEEYITYNSSMNLDQWIKDNIISL